MYGVKRIEFDEFKQVRAVEFYEGLNPEEIKKALQELRVMPKLTIKRNVTRDDTDNRCPHCHKIIPPGYEHQPIYLNLEYKSCVEINRAADIHDYISITEPSNES